MGMNRAKCNGCKYLMQTKKTDWRKVAMTGLWSQDKKYYCTANHCREIENVTIAQCKRDS